MNFGVRESDFKIVDQLGWLFYKKIKKRYTLTTWHMFIWQALEEIATRYEKMMLDNQNLT